MIEDLNIKDFALIREENLEFTGGLTVLTGETGAGKSILIGALSFLLGGKADTDVIRHGAEEALVSGTFTVDGERDKDALLWLRGAGIEPENRRVLLRRVIRSSGKTGAWIQGHLVTRMELAAFASFLVDIHGQHDHQSLLRVQEHRPYLDSYAGISAEVASFTGRYNALVERRKQRAALDESAGKKAERVELLTFAVQEIESARFKAGEDADLSAEEERLSGFEKLHETLEACARIVDPGGGNLLGLSKQFHGNIGAAALCDRSLAAIDRRAEALFYEMSDIVSDLRSYQDRLVFDQGRFEEVQERLALIYKLKKKYAAPSAPLSDVIDYGEKAKAELEILSRGSESRAALDAEIAALEKEVYTAAKSISLRRRAAADKMSAQVAGVLGKLGMKGPRFTVGITEKEGTEVEQRCGPYGMDNIEFLISANLGAPERPLAKIASGGELSRVMLALKTVLASSDTRGTLVFDEIDTGIGGEVAGAVGSHLKGLAKNQQVFCITHLASIAVFADTHLLIRKNAENGAASTAVSTLRAEARVAEIARMLAGDAASKESLDHARALLEARHE